MDTFNHLPGFDQSYEIIGTQKYLDKYTRINNCKYVDERNKYKLGVKLNEKRVNEQPCMCIKEWRYEQNKPLFYKGKIKDIDWKPNKFYCDDNTLVEDLRKMKHPVKIINNGIDSSNQDKLKELNRKYGFDYYMKNNVSKCSSPQMFDITHQTDPKWGCSKNNLSMYGDSDEPREYWHKLSEKKYLRKGPYTLCNAGFNNAPFSLGNYSVNVKCEENNDEPSNSLWHNMTKRKSLY